MPVCAPLPMAAIGWGESLAGPAATARGAGGAPAPASSVSSTEDGAAAEAAGCSRCLASWPTRIDGVNTTAVVITTASTFENRTTGVYRNPTTLLVYCRFLPCLLPVWRRRHWNLSVAGPAG